MRAREVILISSRSTRALLQRYALERFTLDDWKQICNSCFAIKHVFHWISMRPTKTEGLESYGA